MNDSLVTLEALGLSAPVLALDDADVAILPEPFDDCMPGTPNYSSTDSSGSNGCFNRATPHRKIRARRDELGATSPILHRHHFKRTSRKDVHELQAKVFEMQTQIDCANAEFHQLAHLVDLFAHQREQDQQEHEIVQRQERQLYKEHEMNMSLDEQRRHLRAQVEHDREQYEREQQRCVDCQSAHPPPEQEAYRF